MAKKNPPSMVTYGRIDHIVKKIKEAKTPERFTNDFLKEVLQAKGSNDRAFISLSKRCGLLKEDGSPTERYKRLRSTDDSVSKAAMAEAIKSGYSDLYTINEYVHKLSEKELKGLVIQFTGDEQESKSVLNIVKTFFALKKHADFEGEPIIDNSDEKSEENEGEEPSDPTNPVFDKNLNLGLSYQINLVLPKTDDIAVFKAIFKSLRNNLLEK